MITDTETPKYSEKFWRFELRHNNNPPPPRLLMQLCQNDMVRWHHLLCPLLLQTKRKYLGHQWTVIYGMFPFKLPSFESAIAQVLPCCGRDDAQQWLLHPQYLPPPAVIITRSYPTWVRRLVSLPTRTPPSVSSHEISRNSQSKTLQNEVTMDGLRGEGGFYGSLSHNCASTVWWNTLQNPHRNNDIWAFYVTFFQGFKTLFEYGPVCLSRQSITNFICRIFLEWSIAKVL